MSLINDEVILDGQDEKHQIGNELDLLDGIDDNDLEEEMGMLTLKQRRKENQKYSKLTMIEVILGLIGLIAGVFLFIYSYYFNINALDTALTSNQKTFVTYFNKYQDLLDSVLSTSNVVSTQNIYWKNGEKNQVSKSIDALVENKDIPYLTKRSELNSYVNEILSTIKNDDSTLEKVKKDISLYGFLPKQVTDIIVSNELKRSLLSIETVKLYTAMDIFSKLDNFLEDLSINMSSGPSSLKIALNYFLDRGEVDIQKYLTDCYLNPYVIDYRSCTVFSQTESDFDAYYEKNYLNGSFDSESLKKIITFIIDWLDRADDIPTLAIILNDLDPTSNKISFSIDINTKASDSASLLKQKILNPHIYIVKILVNALRMSHFIEGDTIKIDNLKINQKDIQIADLEVSVENSSFSFDIPVQKNVDVEIFDNVYSN